MRGSHVVATGFGVWTILDSLGARPWGMGTAPHTSPP